MLLQSYASSAFASDTGEQLRFVPPDVRSRLKAQVYAERRMMRVAAFRKKGKASASSTAAAVVIPNKEQWLEISESNTFRHRVLKPLFHHLCSELVPTWISPKQQQKQKQKQKQQDNKTLWRRGYWYALSHQRRSTLYDEMDWLLPAMNSAMRDALLLRMQGNTKPKNIASLMVLILRVVPRILWCVNDDDDAAITPMLRRSAYEIWTKMLVFLATIPGWSKWSVEDVVAYKNKKKFLTQKDVENMFSVVFAHVPMRALNKAACNEFYDDIFKSSEEEQGAFKALRNGSSAAAVVVAAPVVRNS